MNYEPKSVLVSQARESDTPWDFSFAHQAADIIGKQGKTIMQLRSELSTFGGLVPLR